MKNMDAASEEFIRKWHQAHEISTKDFHKLAVYDNVTVNWIVNSTMKIVEKKTCKLEIHQFVPTKYIARLNIKCESENILNIKISDNIHQRIIYVDDALTIHFSEPAISINIGFNTKLLFRDFLRAFITCCMTCPERKKDTSLSLLEINPSTFPFSRLAFDEFCQLYLVQDDDEIKAFYELMLLHVNDENASTLLTTLESRAEIVELSFARNIIPTLGSSPWNWINVTCLHRTLTYLDLNDNDITELPEEIGYFKTLYELHLDDNKLQSLPQSLGDLPIIYLAAANNNFGAENSNWNWMKGEKLRAHLNKLVLSANNITQLPSEIGFLKKLDRLELVDNKISNLLETIGSLNFKYLLLNENNLGECTNWEWLNGKNIQKSLTFLNLALNNMEVLPDEICKLNALAMIILTDNKLIKLPDGLGSMERLETLIVTNNKLGMTDSSYWNWMNGVKIRKNLQNLLLDNNCITKLPHSIGNLKNLRSLSVSQNHFEKLPLSVRNSKFELITILHSNLKSLSGYCADKFFHYNRRKDQYAIVKALRNFDVSRLPPQSAVETLQELALRQIWIHKIAYKSAGLPKCLIACLDYPVFCECGKRRYKNYASMKINVAIDSFRMDRQFHWVNQQGITSIAVEYIFCSVSCYRRKHNKIVADIKNGLPRSQRH